MTNKTGSLSDLLSSNEDKVIIEAMKILESRVKYADGSFLGNPETVKNLCRLKVQDSEKELFCVIFMDAKHKVIEFKTMFSGTINMSSVYPREIVKQSLALNAQSVIFCHNHPSGDPSPSKPDIKITKDLQEILSVVGVEVLDHIIVGRDSYSFAENGLI